MAHTTQEDLRKKLSLALKKVSVGHPYYHFKNPDQKYIVEFVGFLENSEEVCVGYRALYDEGLLWVRTLEDFLEEKEIEGQKVPRFTRL